MANYDATTGHMTSPHAHAHAGEDNSAELDYTCTCDGRVSYRVRAVDAYTAERKARKLYYDDAGQMPSSVDVR